MPLTNGFISGPYTNIWVGKIEVPDVVHVAPMNSLEHGLKYLVFLFLLSVGTLNILKVLQLMFWLC